MLASAIKLYKKVPSSIDDIPYEPVDRESAKEFLKETIPYGFILSNGIYTSFDKDSVIKIIKIIKNELTLSGYEMNASFHKSWGKVKNSSNAELFLEQIIHYMSTYGLENMGIERKEDLVYIPHEKLNIPDIKDPIQIVVIKSCSYQWLMNKVMELVNSGIALEKETIDAVIDIIKNIGIDVNEINDISNKEVKTILCKHYEILPENPTDFLRYLIYETTGESLLIKNNYIINKLKVADKDKINNLLNEYLEYYFEGYINLASIFYRFKPLFLALRGKKDINKIVNKVRRFAKQYHEPMQEDYLNNITNYLKNEIPINYDIFDKELSRVNIFRKVRLLEALNFRINTDNNSIVYRIRNGKSFATTFKPVDEKNVSSYDFLMCAIVKKIIEDIRPNIEGKNIYIPKDIEYALPSSEKQFFGNIPSGSCINVDDGDIVFGVHWENLEHKRVDLDLSLTRIGEKIGWDSDYRNDSKSVLFSGDITDAPVSRGGASEMFYINKDTNSSYVNYLNFFNYYDRDKDTEIPYKFYVGSQKTTKMENNFMIDPNNVICVIPKVLKEKQEMIGFVDNYKGKSKYYFIGMGSGKDRTVNPNGTREEQIFNYLLSKTRNSIKFNQILEAAGAIIYNSKEDIIAKEIEIDINLSPEDLEKDTIINLLDTK